MVNRKIKIWLKVKEDCKILYKNTEYKKIFNLPKTIHNTFITVPIDECDFTITCLAGSLEIRNIEINYSTQINLYYRKNFPKDTIHFIKNNFDLSKCSDKFLKNLETINFFISTGSNKFSANTNLKNSVKLNGLNVDTSSEFYILKATDEIEYKIFLTKPFKKEKIITKNAFLSPIIVNSFDEEFSSQLDGKFYNFVSRYLHDQRVTWDDIQNNYDVPYTYKVRTQAIVSNNIEWIKNKKIVDFGSDRGHLLYPCIVAKCKSITGAQILKKFNNAINLALTNMNLHHIGRAVECDVYDREQVDVVLREVDTIIFSGLIYHLNNHYTLLQQFTKSNAKNIIIDISLRKTNLKFFNKKTPEIFWLYETQTDPENGQEKNSLNPNETFVGIPNASWVINALTSLGWIIKSNVLTPTMTVDSKNLVYRGVISAYRY